MPVRNYEAVIVFRILFRILCGVFQTIFRIDFKMFSGAISFCRRAALMSCWRVFSAWSRWSSYVLPRILRADWDPHLCILTSRPCNGSKNSDGTPQHAGRHRRLQASRQRARKEKYTLRVFIYYRNLSSVAPMLFGK